MSSILVTSLHFLTMIDIYSFNRDEYTLLVVETRDFQPLDIEKIKSSYPEVDGTKGVAIAAPPETDLTAIGDLFSWYRNRSQWQGGYNAKLHGILVGNAFGGCGKVRAEVIKAQLPCLECFRELNEEVLIKPGARYPYCEGHYARSPHRSGSRRKKV